MELIGVPSTVQVFDPTKLTPHPRNEYFFPKGDDDQDLMESIRARGIIDMPLVSDTGVIISGHRRVRIAQQLNFDQIQCQVRHYENEDMMLYDLICSNIMSRGGLAGLSALYGARCISELRRLYANAGQRNVANCISPIGMHKTVAEMAEELGTSRSVMGRAQTIMKVEDELAERLDPCVSSAVLMEVGNLSPEAQAELKAVLPPKFTGEFVLSIIRALKTKDEVIDRLNKESAEMEEKLDRMTARLSKAEEAANPNADLQDEIERRLELEDKLRESKAQIATLRDQMRKQAKQAAEDKQAAVERAQQEAADAAVQYVEVEPDDYAQVKQENESLRRQVDKLSKLNALGEFAKTNIVSLQNIVKNIDIPDVAQKAKTAEIALGDLFHSVEAMMA